MRESDNSHHADHYPTHLESDDPPSGRRRSCLSSQLERPSEHRINLGHSFPPRLVPAHRFVEDCQVGELEVSAAFP